MVLYRSKSQTIQTAFVNDVLRHNVNDVLRQSVNDVLRHGTYSLTSYYKEFIVE